MAQATVVANIGVLSYHDISNLLPSYFKVKDRNDEDDDSEEDDDEEDNEEDDDDEEGQENKNLDYKGKIRHPHQGTSRVTGGYNRPSPPQHNSVALQILIDGHQNRLPNAEINKNLINTYNKAVDEGGNLQEIFCRPNSDGVSALTAAVLSPERNYCGVAECILQILFKVFPNYSLALQYINQVDYGGNNIVHEMAYMGQKTIQTMEKLLKLRICCDVSKNSKLIFNSNALNNLGQHPVHFCFQSPTFCREAILVFHNINPNTLASVDCKQNNILHYFMRNLPHFCNNFETCVAAAVAVKEILEFLIGFDVVKACLWSRNNQNITPEDHVRLIEQLDQQAWTASNDFLQVQKKIRQSDPPNPVLLQIPMPPIDVITLDEEEEESEEPIAVPNNSNLPSPGSNLPSPVSNLPSPGANLPAPGSNLPSPGSKLPTPGSNLPTPGSNLTSPGSNLPSPGSNLPSPGSNLPSPGGNLPSPGNNLPSPGNNLPSPGSNLPSPGANLPAPGSNLPSPGSNLPYPGSNLPALGSNLPSPGSYLPFPGSNLPSPGSKLPAPGSNLPTPGSNLPSPGSNLPSSGSNLPSPGGNIPSPGNNLPSPGSNLLSPGGNLPSPGSNLPSPGSNLPSPGAEDSTLLDGDIPDQIDDLLPSILAGCILSFDQGSLVDLQISHLKILQNIVSQDL